MKKIFSYLNASILAIFGLITLFLSSSVIFDLFGVRAQQDNYVLLVIWANFLCSIFYLFAAFGFIAHRKWTSYLLGISSVVLITAFIGLLFHISIGGIYESKTIVALIFRLTLTIGFALSAYYTINKSRSLKDWKEQ